MLKYTKTYIGLLEVPGEVSLVIEISQCPFNCRGCKTPELRTSAGKYLFEDVLRYLIDSANKSITCLCFKGGDVEPYTVNSLASYVRKNYPYMHIAWLSGDIGPSIFMEYQNFDYLKFGKYDKKLGDITSPNTNQRLYKVEGHFLRNITSQCWQQ